MRKYLPSFSPVFFIFFMKTLSAPCFTETEEKKSRFLAYLFPFDAYPHELEKLRKEHPKANHHVSAFRYYDVEKRLNEGAKDDGEPSGSAGMPALKVLQGEELVNICVIIVRYFGGIKLGTGGMARAYSAATKAVIENASLEDFHFLKSTTLSASFERTSELERFLQNTTILERRYTDGGIEIDIQATEEEIAKLEQAWNLINY